MSKDIAVLEGYQQNEAWGGGEWAVLAYIGPDRAGGVLDKYGEDRYQTSELRIRYLPKEGEAATDSPTTTPPKPQSQP